MRIILIVLSMMLLSIPAYAVLPISFWGTVEIDNRSAPAGVVVGVYNETGESILNRTTQIIGDKTYYMLDFNSDETTENVFFKVAGVNASQGLQTIGNKSNINLNLSINTLPNGESCEYDIACSSGNCVEGVCRPSGYTTTTTTTTTTVPASRGGGGGGGYSGGGGAWSPTTTIPCPLEYNISMPDKLECYANDIVRIPITITMTRVGCPPADVEVSVDVPSNWTPGHNLVTNLTENETRTVYVTIDVPDVEGNYTLTARSGGIIKEIVLNVKKEMETTTTTSSTTTTVPVTTTIQSAPTGMAIAIEEYGLYILIIIALAVIFFVLTRSLKKRKS